MKRILLAVAALLGVLLLSFVSVLVVTFSGLKEMTDGQILPGGAVRINDGTVSAYLLPIGDKEAALVDCGNDETAAAIKASLARKALTPDSVKAIFLTHGHPDHIKGCKQFPKAQVYIGAGEEHLVDGTMGSKGPLPRMFGAMPKLALAGARTVRDGEVVEVGGLQVKVFVLPGHTAGSAAFLASGALYLGDSATLESKGALRPAPWLFSDDQAENVASLKRLGKQLAPGEVKALVPAHSGSSEGGAALASFAAQ